MKYILYFLFLFSSFHVWAQQEEILRIQLPDGHLEGFLTVADSTKPTPVILIIPGSGPTDHNGNNAMMKNNSLKMLGDSLAKHHISSLRIDKRGIGQSHIRDFKETDIRFYDFVQDAIWWLEKLKKDRRFSKIIVAGHSQGALVALLAACKTKPDAYISIAGAGYNIADVIKKQLSQALPMIKKAAYQIVDSLQDGHKVSKIPVMLQALFRPSVQNFLISWMAYDPAKKLKSCKLPILIIQGDTDLQVGIDDAQRLHKFNSQARLVILKGMNHILKRAPLIRAANFKTYNQPNLALDSDLVFEIVRFVKRLN